MVASELQSNGLGALPGAIYQSQAGSPIHWQPWTKVSLQRAKDARRLVFAVIDMPQDPSFQSVLADLTSNPAVVTIINDQYVPVLIDGDAAREIGLVTADLCAEIKRPLQLPLFVWMAYTGNPVAWIPAGVTEPGAVVKLFKQSHTMVGQMWAEDLPRMINDSGTSYVVDNSERNNAGRSKRLEQRIHPKMLSESPALVVSRSLRQLASLYDPYTRSFDEAGSLFPSAAIELLATAAVHPGLPEDVRSRALTTTRELLTDLLPSAMFDPLDGGVFAGRAGPSWSLPSFTRNCLGQTRVAMALLQAYRATGDQRVLEKALGVIAFAEKSYLTKDQLLAVGLTTETPPTAWMWRVEDVTKVLAPDDAAWWIKATGMKGQGNLAAEVDPQQEFSHRNTLGLTKSVAAIAAELSQPVDVFGARLTTVKNQLLTVRNARLGELRRDNESHAGASFRMVSTYAAAFGATGDEVFRDKAVALLRRAREAFSVGPRLRVFAKDAPDSVGAGRAFIYALALQAVIDVATITSDDHWLFWSEDLAATAAELFAGSGFLKECPETAEIIKLPISDQVMLFDDSTVGLISLAECRLAARGRPLVASLSQLATPLPSTLATVPIIHTDLLLATLARHYPVTVLLGSDLAPDLKLASERLQLRAVQHRSALPADQVPAGAVKVMLPAGDSRLVTTAAALQQALLPLPGK